MRTLTLVTILGLSFITACSGETEAAPPLPAAANAPAPATAPAAAAPAAQPAPAPATPPPATFTWTETPELTGIPAGPIRGMANGQPFEARGIYLEPLFGRWSMVIADQPLAQPTGFLPAGYQAVNVSGLPRDLHVGTYRKSMEESGGGHFQIRSPDDPSTTTSWNSPNAYVLEITRWEVAQYDPSASMFQVAGRASGRIVVVYRGYGDGRFQNSWVAGTFTDVPVRYMGEPRWQEQ